VLDRFNAANPATDEKIWRIWVPAQPEFVNGRQTEPRAGLWQSDDSDTIRLTNKFGGLQGKEFKSAPTHGRFYMKTLLPRTPVIRFLGGPGMEFQSGDGDGTTPWGTPAMTQAEREYLGWGRVEVHPASRQAYDVFLNVIQIGDANTLAAMSPVSPVSSANDVSTGAHIADPENQWIVMASRGASDRYELRDTAYSFKSVAARSRHLLVNMARETAFHVKVSTIGPDTKIEIASAAGAGSTTVRSNDQGVLSFEVNGTQVK
jgi:hypothetical protein